MTAETGCGSCNLCCKLLAVPDIKKPAQMLCWWTNIHGGCARQADKPNDYNPDGDPSLAACAQFQCLWLASQSHSDPTKRHPRMMRPDITHVVMGPEDRNIDGLLYVQVDPEYPSAYKEPAIAQYLAECIDRGGRIEIIMGDKRFELEREGA